MLTNQLYNQNNGHFKTRAYQSSRTVHKERKAFLSYFIKHTILKESRHD